MERKPIEHVGEEKLEAYVMNTLAEKELACVEEHLLFCGSCQDQVEELERYTKAMQSAALRIREEKSAMPLFPSVWDRFRGWVPAPLPVFSGALAMLALIVVFGLRSGFYQEDKPGPAVDVELQATRGAAPNIAESGHALHLRLDSRGVEENPAWKIEIVDEHGSKIWTGTGTWSDTWIQASVEKSFRPGSYFVRLLKEHEDVIREYHLVINKPRQ